MIENEIPPRAVAEINSRALVQNYDRIREIAHGQDILPMVKTNAYGHGVGCAAKALSPLRRLYGLGVATLKEGEELRRILGKGGAKVSVLVFSDVSPWTEEKGRFCQYYGLTPVIATEEDWYSFLNGKWPSRVSYEIQFNTGMNRLGLSLSSVGRVSQDLKGMNRDHHPKGILSHFAISESPQTKLSRQQLEGFRFLRKEFHSIVPRARFHLANSGGIWNFKNYGLKELTEVVRPGLSLYGIPPWPDAPRLGIVPVLTFKVKVVGIHCLKAGDFIGYGGTYQVKGSKPIFAAILGAGYGDGVMRALSNRGYAVLDGKKTRFLGRVSMDLCAIQCGSKTRVGSWAELMGPQVDPWVQAKAAGTIPYELLTSLSGRVKRIYDSNDSDDSGAPNGSSS